MGKWTDEAKRMLPFIRQGVQKLSDQDALQIKTIYPTWESLVEIGNVKSAAGYKFSYGDDLYKCVNSDPTFSAEWIPGNGTESLYIRIDETHTGTYEDPIPYNGNMELISGKYYSQSGVIYVCIRDTVNPVYNALSDLIGIYVEVA